MTALSGNAAARLISDQIRRPLRKVSERHWTVLTATGILQTLTASLATLLGIALLLGFLPGLPALLRILLAAVVWIVVAGSAFVFLRPALRRWSLSRAALQVEHSQPHIQERISSAVELTEEMDPRFRGSNDLIAHLVHQAEADAGAVNPQAVVSSRPVKKWALILAPLLLLWMVLAVLKPLPVEAGLYRILMPWKSQLPALLSSIYVEPRDVTLAQGDSVDIRARVSSQIGGQEGDVASVALITKYASGQSVSRALDRTEGRQFHALVENLQQSFSYKLTTTGAESPWYTVTVRPRPAIARLDVHYDYPAYTGIDPRTETLSDGALNAVAGSKATLTVHTSLPLGPTSQLLLDEGKPEQIAIPLVKAPGDAMEYSGVIPMTHTTQYRIQLFAEDGLPNKDDQSRDLVAKPDQPPTIVIQSPGATSSARPDDVVPVVYEASDDYGISRLQAIVQVDDSAPTTIDFPLPEGDRKDLHGQFHLKLADVLAGDGGKKAKIVTCQLKAFDNRDPDPQFSLSSKQTLKIENWLTETFADREAEKRAKDLEEAIRRAISQLDQTIPKADNVKNRDPRQELNNWEQKEMSLAKDEFSRTAKELTAAAEENMIDPLTVLARKVQDIAEHPITSAADDMALAMLDADKGEDRRTHAAKARDEGDTARQRLRELLEKREAELAVARAEAQHELEQAARREKEIEKAMLEHPEKKDQNQRDQQEALQKLNEAIAKDRDLQDPKAAEEARALADLANRIDQDQKQQQQLEQQAEKQQQDQQKQPVDDAKLANEQKKLNEQIAKFSQDEHKPLDQAHATPPSQDQQNDIVQKLDQKDTADAAREMKQAAQQLQQDAKALDQKANQEQADAKQVAKAQDDARNADSQANDAAQQLPQQSDEAAFQKAEQAAKAIEKAADETKAATPDAQKNLDAAKADAQKAEQALQKAPHQATPEKGAEKVKEAADDLQKASQELAQGEQQNADAQPPAQQEQAAQQDQQAAQQASQLAQQQAQLAREANPQGDQQQQLARQEQQLAQQTQQEQQQAQQLADQAAQNHDPDVQQRAGAAKQELQQASQQQQQAADAEKNNDPQAAEQHQQEAQQDLAKASAELQGQAEQVANADQKPADAQQPGEQPGEHPGQEAGQPQEPHQGDAQGEPKAEAGQGEHPGQHSGQGQPAGKPQTAEQARAEAAEQAQEATHDEQKAMQSNAQAAGQAANALERAAQALARSQGQEAGEEEGQADEPGSKGKGKGQKPGKQAGHSTDSSQGIASSDAGGNNTRPKSVEALGVSASDWAKLPPLMQQQLQNAAQQSGPAAYREMIKNYYVRLAQMQEPGSR